MLSNPEKRRTRKLKKTVLNRPEPASRNLPDGEKPHDFFREISIQFLVHELKGPVSIIETNVRMLLEKQVKYGSFAPQQQKTLERVLKNSVKARTMLYDLLEVGRSESGCFMCSGFKPARSAYKTLVDVLEMMVPDAYEELRDLKLEAAGELLARRGIFMEIEPGLSGVEMFQDETKFRQVVGNLIQNALRYRKKRLVLKLAHSADQFFVEVQDDGPGIDPKEHEAIFRCYIQSKSEQPQTRTGHGLGLAGALIIARSLGGDIRIQSEPGKGAVFCFRVPLQFNADIT